MLQDRLSGVVSSLQSSWDSSSKEQRWAIGAVAGATGCALIARLFSSGSSSHKRKPSTWELTGGSIARDSVAKEFKQYSASYGADGTGTGITDRERTVQLVDVFYSLVTDIYEWGWGQSFHFSPKLPHKSWEGSEAAHEARIATVLQAKPGDKILDCGCGVGGPMRTISAVSGAHVVGITINDYQVQRAVRHNQKQGLGPLTSVVRGDFTQMPFEAKSFDGAYAIEATCHAPKLEAVYGEIFRVLKPGATFVSYEWVSTPKYNPNNPEHVRIMDEINFGNGLPEMRSWKDAEEAGKKVGFELVWSINLATSSVVCGPWYHRLSKLTYMHHINHCIVSFFDFLRLTPKGMKEVHMMLVRVARSLIAGGESDTFTPMQMLVFRKPAK
uniref:Methyltransferase n=1 Tax=Dunaliella tertiolecta TaxID=3047 RepID=A0A7S3QZT3_DUNTE|mmetsp:Transcript_6388/g.17039  ORF Transcript_6388/g.17039 Transcript_6388/m.17039 type:complete len:385 (-) Transcript_6388:398-1552(-)|eukprot:CAMPEP_0202355166 /NCGR_PEP_ID=MMETSP1126-20121109/10175_1 /ASSEMBLY_ACC=CAM_ASM_000457 /TAXON_ID=3047 /ORGANISM="Dunaliella tertiolecta, Strain CCMP1320" /LENGTH=384 /DNA_ID=CAMNT_0048947739 /DNA_START=100 /DNA_END=1254 /DNA_ORIENTATION=+